VSASLVIAGSCLKCGLRSKGLWAVIVATLVPMLILNVGLMLIPDQMWTLAVQVAAGFHGEDVGSATEWVKETTGQAEQKRELVLNTSVSGSIRVIGAVASLIAIFFTALTNEAGRKSLAHVLSHPIRRSSIVLGSFLGTLAVVVPCVFAMTVFAFVLLLIESGKADWPFFLSGLYLLAGVTVTTAYAVAFTTALPAIVGVFASVGYTWIAAKTYSVHLILQQVTGVAEHLGRAWLYLIPRLGDFSTIAIDKAMAWSMDEATAPPITGNMTAGFILAALHVVFALTLATMSLRRKQV